MLRTLITGGAGFIGSHLAERLLRRGEQIICVDNFELGCKENVQHLLDDSNFTLIQADASDVDRLDAIMKKYKIDNIYHLAANSDIYKSSKLPSIDFQNTFKTTYSVLEGMRRNDIKKLFFASTSAVYGDKTEIALSESIGELAPISYYGGAKLASEAFISSFAYMNNIDVSIFRFPNVIGPRLTHGVIFDFLSKLRKDPSTLEILGDGTQCKPYLFVLDLIDAINLIFGKNEQGVNIYNVGVQSATTVKEIADMVCRKLDLMNVTYQFSGGNCGWKGDVSKFQYDLTKIHKMGWRAKYTSNESVWKTLESIEK